MGNNSILSNPARKATIASVRMLLSADLKKISIFLLVEGVSDLNFFRGRLDKNVQMMESFNGIIGLKEIVEHFQNNRVIGICDRDYDTSYSNPQIMFYDFCCLEMMLIFNDEAFKSVHNECYAGNMPPIELRNHILNQLLFVSSFRRINFLRGLSFNFQKISFSKALDKAKCEIVIDSIIEQLGNNMIAEYEYIINEVSQCCTNCIEYNELLHITNGHDFMNCMQAISDTNKPAGTKGRKSEIIFMMFRAAYRDADFRMSFLYSCIQDYEQKYSLSILLNA